MRSRFRVLAVVLSLLGLALTTSIDANQTGSPPPDPSAVVDVERLFSTPPLSSLPRDQSLAVQRITYQPGATLELTYRGPIVYYVESGSLAVLVDPADDQVILSAALDSSALRSDSAEEGEIVLAEGDAILSETGNLGRSRNPDDEPAVVLAVLVVSQSPGEGISEVEGEEDVPVADGTPIARVA